ncbi:hypothetical protein [Exiguobacterium artemiae]|uniref:hypothetical protein n=1 Tax=Exiguobacterium artemiae TaxID=340145 RepID=UPI000479D98D|nr:hypothetical protein [Exiguobacterium sibiricum]
MPYEIGGRSDKEGNRYEIKYSIYKIIEVIEEKIDYLVIEAIGEDEQGIDVWIGNKDGSKEGQQCKGRNGGEDSWNFGTANAKSIFENWKKHLDRDSKNHVSLVTPLAFQDLEDIIKRVKNSNENPRDFYEYQVKKSNKKFQNFYSNFCAKMGLNIKEDKDIQKSIYYLKRVSFHQVPDSYLKEMIFQKISYLFYGNEKEIYDNLISLVVDGDILGKQINLGLIRNHIKKNNLRLKNLSFDTRILPKIERLNWEFKNDFQLLNKVFLERKQYEEAYNFIEKNESFIIHGKAGIGKSGTTEAIIKYCDLKAIPYLAIKLDKRIPNYNAKKWGEELGLPDSIVNCLHSISKNEKAVLILDQLDALRWTLAHSRNALLVCSEIIQQINYLNSERENKISIVMVCRTIDLESDNNIRNLFKEETDSQSFTKWKKIKINELEDSEVERIIGDRYKILTPKLKKMLKISSNLLIWCQLDISKTHNECLSTNHLIEKWWDQLLANYSIQGHAQKELDNFKVELINKFIDLERIYVPKRSFRGNKEEIDFLHSNGFINISEEKISFSHQSILDYLLSEKMLDKYFDGIPINEILGSKEMQTPGKRYQLQMAMQYLLELESKDFIKAGIQLLNGSDIRYFNKYVFLEILRDIDVLDPNINKFILSYCEDVKWKDHLLQNVIYSKQVYYKLLLNNGIIEKWLGSEKEEKNAINLISSIKPKYDLEDINLIKQYFLEDKKHSNDFKKIFSRDFHQDSNELFDLRILFYKENPHLSHHYLDVNESLKNNEYRTIKYIEFLIEKKLNDKDDQNEFLEKKIFLEDKNFIINDGEYVYKSLSKFIPSDTNEVNDFSEWSAVHYKNSLERTIVIILKKSINSIIFKDPESFKNILLDLSKNSNDVINELIIEGLDSLNNEYSDYVIEFICENFENRIFIKSDGSKNVLSLVKKCLINHSHTCSNQIFTKLENKILKYMPNGAKEYIKYRYKFNKNKNKNTDEKVYWSFWGDLQIELLSILPIERLTNESIELLNVLQRKFKGKSNRYNYALSTSGFVKSPIDGKELSLISWSNIISKKKEDFDTKNKWISVSGGIIEGSIQQFASSFSQEVSKNPLEMIKIVLNNKNKIEKEFIDAMYSSLAFIDLTDLPNELLIKLIERFSDNINSFRAQNICRIIQNNKDIKWSDSILNTLISIATSSNVFLIDDHMTSNKEDENLLSFDTLYTNSLNCAECCAARAIESLIWYKPDYYPLFKSSINSLVNHPSTAVKLASVSTLRSVINIDNEFATEKIIKLYEDDFRVAGNINTRDVLFHAYTSNPKLVLETILKCFHSSDNDLIKIGSYSVAEMYLNNNEFNHEVKNLQNFTEKQIQSFLEMIIIYFEYDEYNQKCKEILSVSLDVDYELENVFSKLFYKKSLKLSRDFDFLNLIMKSNLSQQIMYSFVKYLEEENKSLTAYSEVILNLCNRVIEDFKHNSKNKWGVEEELSKLIIGLFDESNQNSKLSNTASKSLELWDKMFEFRIGSIRELSGKIMNR